MRPKDATGLTRISLSFVFADARQDGYELPFKFAYILYQILKSVSIEFAYVSVCRVVLKGTSVMIFAVLSVTYIL